MKTIWYIIVIFISITCTLYIQYQIILQLVRTDYFLFCIPSKKITFFCNELPYEPQIWTLIYIVIPKWSFFKAKINLVKRSTGGFHWPRVEMQYLIKTTLYCVTITIQTSCLAGVVSIDSGLELIYQFVSFLQVKEQRNRRLEERKGEISLIGSAAVLLNAEIKGSMCFGFAYIDFFTFISLSPGQT